MRKMIIAICAIADIVPMLILIQLLTGLTQNTSSSMYPRFISYSPGHPKCVIKYNSVNPNSFGPFVYLSKKKKVKKTIFGL